jgi:DNA polymerase-3 subunit alpha
MIEARKKGDFHSFKDFLMRVDLRKVNKRTVESLIKCGGFSQFANKATLLAFYPEVLNDVQRNKVKIEKGQFDLFETESDGAFPKDNFKEIPELPEDDLFSMEREVIGFLIGKNPLLKFQKIIDKKVTKKIGEISADDVNKPLIIAGIISGKKALKTKKDNSEMAIITVFDETGSIEIVVFPKSFAKLKSILMINRVIMLKGKVNDREGRIGLIMENAVDLEQIHN